MEPILIESDQESQGPPEAQEKADEIVIWIQSDTYWRIEYSPILVWL